MLLSYFGQQPLNRDRSTVITKIRCLLLLFARVLDLDSDWAGLQLFFVGADGDIDRSADDDEPSAFVLMVLRAPLP